MLVLSQTLHSITEPTFPAWVRKTALVSKGQSQSDIELTIVVEEGKYSGREYEERATHNRHGNNGGQGAESMNNAASEVVGKGAVDSCNR